MIIHITSIIIRKASIILNWKYLTDKNKKIKAKNKKKVKNHN